MSLNLIKQILANDADARLAGSIVIDEATGKSFSEHVADASAHLTAADVEKQIEPLKKILNDFLTGEDDGGDIDRLTELVKAIGDNKDSIDKLTAGNHTHENSEILNAIGKDASGNLTFNDHVLDGSTGVAIVGKSSDTPAFDGKVVFVVEAYTPPVQETEPAA